jgi:hypothetical protein
MKRILLAALLAFPLLAARPVPTKADPRGRRLRHGGTTDVTARIIAAALSQSLGQPVVIDNKPGADGIIAGSEVVKSAPDGYTIFFGTYTQVSALPSLRKNVPFDPLVDLTPIGCIGNFTFFWAVNAELPIRNMKELAAYGRANPGKLNAGSSGAAATIAPTMFARAEKFDLQVVAYKSETTALNDLVGGRIQLMLASGTLGAAAARRPRARARDAGQPAQPGDSRVADHGRKPASRRSRPCRGWACSARRRCRARSSERLSRELLAVLKNPEVRERVERQAIELNPLRRRPSPRWRKSRPKCGGASTKEAWLHPPVTTQVVSGKYVLGERDGAQVLLEDHYVYVDGSRIEAVTRDAPAAGQEVIRYEHGLVMPGFVNLHAHCIRGGLFRGIPDDLEIGARTSRSSSTTSCCR